MPQTRAAALRASQSASPIVSQLSRFRTTEHPQAESPLFQLPAELRDWIYDLALASYEDESQKYDPNTYWSRPGYLAPYKSDVALLRTCKKAYRETWFKPWSLAAHSFWLTSADRAPEKAMSLERFQMALQQIHAHQGETEVNHIRVFAQMFKLEEFSGASLQGLLSLEHCYPKSITITIRHTDWWYWESDQGLRFKGVIPRENVFPKSIHNVTLELETLERKKSQLDWIVAKMKADWTFKRQDGVYLTARDTATSVQRWKGSSTWNKQRWLRDETQPGCIDYYIVSVHWRPELSSSGRAHPVPIDITPPLKRSDQLSRHVEFTDYLDSAGVTPSMTAQEVKTRMLAWRRHRSIHRKNSMAERELEAEEVRVMSSTYYN